MRSKSTIINNKRTIAAVSITAIIAMVLMSFLVKPAMADNGEDAVFCDPEVVEDTSGKADYVYKLDTDCTLHIGPTNIPSRNEPSPIQQHDKVRRIVFDDPEKTSLDEYSSYLFYGYPNVRSIEGLDKLDVSHVMQFANTFAGLNLEEPADLSSWNVNAAWNFQSMFQGSNLDGFKGIDKFTFDLSNKVQWYARDFQLMFKDTTSTKGIDLSGWKFLHPQESNGVIFGSMFDGAKTPKIDVSSFSDLDIGAGASGMFANTNTDIEGLDRFPTQSVMDTSRMFENAKPTNQVDLSSWNTENLYNAESMFNGSDIDKFIGLDKWDLSSLTNARAMYANLHPSHPVYIQTNLPHLNMGSGMFSGTDIDMFPNIDKMQLSTNGLMPEMMFDGMFENSTATYLSMSKWTNGPGMLIPGMLASPNIKYTTFGNKTVGSDYSSDFIINSGPELFSGRSQDPNEFQSVNVWDRTDLPKEYSAKKWTILPIKPECDAQFDGDPDKLPKDCWDDSQSWVSDKTGEEADEELLDNTAKHYQRIFFRAESVPVNFNANGVENAQDMSDMKYFLKTFTSKDDLIPDTTPKDPTGAKVFDSWNDQADGKGKTYHPGDHIGHDLKSIDLYAQWRNKAPKVQFNNNGGEGSTPTVKPTGDDTQIAVDCTDRPSKDGATFIGWSKTKNDVLEGSEAGEKGQIVVCGYSSKKTITGLQGKTIDLYAAWARKPKAVFNENRPKDMTSLLPETKTITGDWYVDDSTPRTYVASNIDGWNKGYTPDGVYRFDGWMNENGSPFTGAYLERSDIIINAKWSKIAPADNHNNGNGQNNHDNGTNDDNNGDTVDDNANNNHGNNGSDNGSNSGSGTTNNQQASRPGATPIINSGNNQATDSSSRFDPTSESPLNASGESSNDSGSGYVADSDTGSQPSQSADTSGNNSLAKTGASIIVLIVLAIVSIISAAAAILLGRTRSGRQQ